MATTEFCCVLFQEYIWLDMGMAPDPRSRVITSRPKVKGNYPKVSSTQGSSGKEADSRRSLPFPGLSVNADSVHMPATAAEDSHML